MSCWISSSRVHTTLTGPSTCLAMRTALVDHVRLEPAAEAAAEQMVVHGDLLDGRPAALAAAACTRVMTCVPIQTSHAPGVRCTVQFIGSMVACARNGIS